MMQTAANEPQFEPLALSDPAFIAWALRVGLRLRNKAPGAPDGAILRTIMMEGALIPEWAQALVFLMTLAPGKQAQQRNKRVNQF